MIQRRLAVLGTIVLVSAMASWWIQQSAETRRRQQDEEGQRQAQHLLALAEENARLSNQVSQAQNKARLSNEQFHELLRLRNEVGQLHRTAREMDELRATNQLHQKVLAEAGVPVPPETPVPGGPAPPGYWARDQFAYVGFDDPESALKTTLWLWADASFDAILALCTPEQRLELEKERGGVSEADMAAQHRGIQALYSLDKGGVSVLGKKMTSPEEATVDLYFEGDGKIRRFGLNKSGEQWVVNRLDAIYD